MNRNLGFGTKLIRILLTGGIFISLCMAAFMQDLPGSIRFYFLANSLTFLAVLLILAARKLPTRVKKLSMVMDQAADGNLAIRCDDLSGDEVGMLNQNFNEMLERLGGMVINIRSAVEQLRVIGADVGRLATEGLSVAEGQKDTADRTKISARQIRGAVEEVNAAIGSLADSASNNATSIQQMVSSTAQIGFLMEELQRAVEMVSDSIVRMAGGQNEINANVQHLLDNAKHTTTLVSDMERSVLMIGESAQTTVRISTDVMRDAELGHRSVESTISGIQQIRSASQTAQEAISNLSVHAANIGTILQVIDEVAEQTKLLALNASIIAAQAGEHGKGFGVVAFEIKELARRTTSSTREIAEIVNGVKEETEKAVSAIAITETAVTEGEQLSYRSGEALYKIVNGVKTAAEQANEIATTTLQHVTQGERMRLAMEEIGTMVEQIVRASGFLTRDTEVINQTSGNMRQLASNVLLSATARSDAGAVISASTNTMVQMVDEIRHSCQVQLEASEQVVHTAEEVEQAATGNLNASRSMEEVVKGLSLQIRNLEKEMESFKTT